MPVKDPQRNVVGVPRHEPHEEAIVPDVVRPQDDEVEQVPDAGLLDVLEDELSDEVVGVVGVAVQERGKKAKEFALLQRDKWG